MYLREERRGAVDLDKLRAEIVERLGRRVRGLDIQIRHHGLVLKGQVSSYYLKQLVQEAVLAASTMPLEANEIKVCPSGAGWAALEGPT
jgi:hypothetical protein